MKITQRVEGDFTVFVPEGWIDTQVAADMDQAFQSAVSSGSHNMVVDMSGVDFISSVGLSALAAALGRCREDGGDMKIAGLNERLARVFRIVGFDVLMSVHDTPEAAISEFSGSAAS